MFLCLRKRLECHRLTWKLLKLITRPGEMQRDANDKGGACLYGSSMRVTLTPRFVRILDRVRVEFNETDVWLPLICRLRIRSAVRWRVALEANQFIDTTKVRQ